MNQKSRQFAKSTIEKDFIKLMSNANNGFDCKNNAKNVSFEAIIDETNWTSYIKKYCSPFDTKVPGFVNSDLSKQETKQTFLQRLTEVKHDDPFRNAQITAIKKSK